MFPVFILLLFLFLVYNAGALLLRAFGFDSPVHCLFGNYFVRWRGSWWLLWETCLAPVTWVTPEVRQSHSLKSWSNFMQKWCRWVGWSILATAGDLITNVQNSLFCCIILSFSISYHFLRNETRNVSRNVSRNLKKKEWKSDVPSGAP